jgi:hypothetical protein
MGDLADVRKNMRDRMRSSGIDKRTAERLAEGSVRRIAERKNRDQLNGREKPRD